jgi:sulfatase maturation enzyme AslB (radical SAM superfamily)
MLTKDAVNAFIAEGYRMGLGNYPMVNQDIPKLNIDVTLTSSCNLKCKYCYERGHFEPLFFSEEQLYVLCHRIEELLKSQWYRSCYKTLKIGFWGGEPTLNYSAMQFIMRYFEYYGDVSFLLYTNGVDLDKVMPSLIYFSNKTTMLNEPKVTVQVSYDGEPIQTKMRGSAVEVQKSIRDFMKYQVFHSVKSTLPFDCMEDMYDAYMDVLNLQSGLQSPRLSFNYNPSLERLMKAPSDDYIQDRLEVFRQQLGYITRIERVLKTELPYLVWSNKRSHSLCCIEIGWRICS